MSQFVTALELATYFNGTTDLDELDPAWVAQADLLLELISDDIEAAAGVRIEAGAGTAVLAGTYDRDLLLPAGPVRDVGAVTINGLILAPHGYWFNDRSVLRRGPDGTETGDDDLDDRSGGALSRSSAHWGGPAATVLVDYSWGFEEVPGAIRSLVLRIAGRSFGNPSGVTQESLAIYSVSYGRQTDDGSHVTAAERRRLRHMLNRTGGTIHTGGR